MIKLTEMHKLKELKEGMILSDFTINKAGAKIYKDTGKHKMLELPVLSNIEEQGAIHEVLSVGFLGGQLGDKREIIANIKALSGYSVAYRLPEGLRGWAEKSMIMKLQGIDLFPDKVEFGILNNKPFADII